ncbi:granzyme E-like [Seriola dumerili]|uniref:trypsin n=1 Tax=Seriola dumerili TaxID=41447 RepID=A0A3B4TI40_SERDU|nr:granzyme E-like [Seriola dumerili]
MYFHCKLVILILALTHDGQVYTGEIFGGHEAVPHSRPYMVLLEQHVEDNKTQHCGGFLLNEDFVMTAAHCQARSYSVLLGVHNFFNSKEVQRITVEKAFPHKDYDPINLKNDIMLLKLKSKAHFNKNVKPIALAGQDDGSLPKSCIVSGWGRSDKNNNFMSVKLMEVNVTLTDNELCAQNEWYCSEGENGPGKGDSGGPLVCEDGKAYGVVTASAELAASKQIHAYTKIPESMKWINSMMEHVYLST